MAIYHCTISNVSRSKGGNSCASLAYISGKKIHDDRSNRNFSYGRRERVIETGTLIPDFAPSDFSDPERIFNSIELHEKNAAARTAKKIEIALPRELTLKQQKKLVEDFIRANFTRHGYCATYAIHNDPDNNNPHVHIMVANRPLDKRGHWAKTNKKTLAFDEDGKKIPVYASDDDADKIPIKDEKGKPVRDKNGNPLYQKVRIRPGKGVEKLWQRVEIESNLIDQRKFLKNLRESWADECNKYYLDGDEIDHRSNKKRGMWDLPTRHEGNAAREMERRGEISDRCQYNRDVRLLNAEHRAVRNEIAALQNEIQTLEKTKIETENKTKTEMQVVHPIFKVSELHKIALSYLKSAGKNLNTYRPGTPARSKAAKSYRQAQAWHRATTELMNEGRKNTQIRVAAGAGSGDPPNPPPPPHGGMGGGGYMDDIREIDAAAILDALANNSADGIVPIEIRLDANDGYHVSWEMMSDYTKSKLMHKLWAKEW